MAHKIETNDRQQGIIQAWHGKTEILPVITLENNWLRDWEIVPLPLYLKGEKGEIETPFRILTCSDSPDISIGQSYNGETFRPVGNGEFLSLVENCISGTGHKITSVGSVRNRGRVFLSVELQGMEKFRAAGRDFSAFLNFGNGHDKSSVLWVNTSNVCTVCDNTFSANLFSQENKKADLKVRVKHTKNVGMKFPEIAKLIDKAIGVQGEFLLALNEAEKIAVSEDTAREIFAGFIGGEVLSSRAENTVGRLVQLFKSGAGNSGRNMADVFSAATDYYSHESSGGDNRAKQFTSSEFGTASQRKNDFFALLNSPEDLENVAAKGRNLLALAN